MKPYYQDNKVSILNGHVITELQGLPDEYVHMSVLSPPYWDEPWLYIEYITNEKSAREIADEQGCKENNILYFLKKHRIKTRTTSEARKVKYWGAKGKANPMFGRVGFLNPNWKGGSCPDRQAFYASQKWKTVIKKLWKRDKATCQKCNWTPSRHGKLHAHHILGFGIRKLQIDLRNLVLLCKDCHSFVHSKANINREFLDDLL